MYCKTKSLLLLICLINGSVEHPQLSLLIGFLISHKCTMCLHLCPEFMFIMQMSDNVTHVQYTDSWFCSF